MNEEYRQGVKEITDTYSDSEYIEIKKLELWTKLTGNRENIHICKYILSFLNKDKYKVCCEAEIKSRKERLKVIEIRYKKEYLIELEEMEDMGMIEEDYLKLRLKVAYNVSEDVGIEMENRNKHMNRIKLYKYNTESIR